MPTPSEQLLTRTLYDTDGVTTNWDFAFSGGYLDKSHVKAYTEASTGERTEIIVTEAMLVGPYQVRIAPALAAGLILTVYRDTPKDLPLVDFTDESGFSEIALDTNAKQAVFIAAETTDTVNTSSSYDAEQAASQAAIAAAAAQVSANAAVASALTAANEADASAASAVLSAGSAVDSANSAASSSAAATTVFNDNTTAYTRTLLDDTSASTARTTLGVTPANIGAAVAGPLATSGITGAAASGTNTDITSLANISSINGGQLAGMRNKIINGKMEIAQRGASFTSGSNVYTLDRWLVDFVADGGATTSQSTDAPSSNELQSSLRLTVNTADASISASQYARFEQRLEGYSSRDLIGRAFTISFSVRSSKTGIHCVALRNSGSDRSYIAEYTVNVANTWEKKAIVLSGGLSTAGTWGWTSGAGLHVAFVIACGTNFQTTANAWQTGNFLSTANQVNCLDTAGNIFAITGVQLEVGSVATPFEHRPYGMELALCQRYFQQPADWYCGSYGRASSDAMFVVPLPVYMRAAPTSNFTASGGYWTGTSGFTGGPRGVNPTNSSMSLVVALDVNGSAVALNIKLSAEL